MHKYCSISYFTGKQFYDKVAVIKGEGKVFYGHEHPSGESTSTECGVNYQLLAVMY